MYYSILYLSYNMHVQIQHSEQHYELHLILTTLTNAPVYAALLCPF